MDYKLVSKDYFQIMFESRLIGLIPSRRGVCMVGIQWMSSSLPRSEQLSLGREGSVEESGGFGIPLRVLALRLAISSAQEFG